MFRRRRIGAAYERAPAERVADWARRNTLVLISGIFAGIAWCGVVIGAYWGMNLISTNTGEMGTEFNDGSPVGIAIKLIGSLIIFILIVKSQSK